jgi:hypothetical protein
MQPGSSLLTEHRNIWITEFRLISVFHYKLNAGTTVQEEPEAWGQDHGTSAASLSLWQSKHQ